MIRRLRDRNEPIRLFGESDYECYLRLKKLETDEPDAREVTNSHFIKIYYKSVLFILLHVSACMHNCKSLVLSTETVMIYELCFL